MKIYFILWILITNPLIKTQLLAQGEFDNCLCMEGLDFLKVYVENNHPAFLDNGNADTEGSYLHHVRHVEGQIKNDLISQPIFLFPYHFQP